MQGRTKQILRATRGVELRARRSSAVPQRVCQEGGKDLAIDGGAFEVREVGRQ